MGQVLKNDLLELHIDGPLEGYRFTRFDWTGKIKQVFFKGIPLTQLEVPGNGDETVLGKGFYNEFGIDEGLGFSDAKEGDWFHKIGVGLLQKDGDQYQFSHPYLVKPASFKTDISNDQVVIQCRGEEVRGYAYELTKKIRLTNSGFRIDYLLYNSGSKPIKTDEYVHNFMGFGESGIQNSYLLSFPFNLHPGEVGAVVNPESLIRVEGETVAFKGTPIDQFFYSELSARKEVKARWELVNESLKIGVRETGDFSTQKVNLWGWKHVVSPELFIPLKLLPGDKKNWSRTYEIFEVGSPHD